jgi:hypothetical protein
MSRDVKMQERALGLHTILPFWSQPANRQIAATPLGSVETSRRPGSSTNLGREVTAQRDLAGAAINKILPAVDEIERVH